MPPAFINVSLPEPFVLFRGKRWRKLTALPPSDNDVLEAVHAAAGFVRISQDAAGWAVGIDERALASVITRSTLRFVPIDLSARNAVVADRLKHDPFFEPRAVCNANIGASCVFTPALWLLLGTPLRRKGVGACLFDTVVPAQYLYTRYRLMLAMLVDLNFQIETRTAIDVPSWAEDTDVDRACAAYCDECDAATVASRLHAYKNACELTASDASAPRPTDDVLRRVFDAIVGFSTEKLSLDALCRDHPELVHHAPTDDTLARARDYERVQWRLSTYEQKLAASKTGDTPDVAVTDAVVRERLEAIADAVLTDKQFAELRTQYPAFGQTAPTAEQLAAIGLFERGGAMTDKQRKQTRKRFPAWRTTIAKAYGDINRKLEQTRESEAAQQKTWDDHIDLLVHQTDSLDLAQLRSALPLFESDRAVAGDLHVLTVRTINSLEMLLMTVVGIPSGMRQALQTSMSVPPPELVGPNIAGLCDVLGGNTMRAIAECDTLLPADIPADLCAAPPSAAAFNAILMYKLKHWRTLYPEPTVNGA